MADPGFPIEWAPLREAVAAWADAVEALNAHVHRVYLTGVADSTLTAQLLADVEVARLHCEQTSLAIQQGGPIPPP
jgi:hypothetical protein